MSSAPSQEHQYHPVNYIEQVLVSQNSHIRTSLKPAVHNDVLLLHLFHLMIIFHLHHVDIIMEIMQVF